MLPVKRQPSVGCVTGAEPQGKADEDVGTPLPPPQVKRLPSHDKGMLQKAYGKRGTV